MKRLQLLLLCMQSMIVFSLPIDYRQHRIDKYDLSDGISTTNIWDIKQDKYGFIWIATTEGINKFNGKEFIKYQKGTGKMCLSNNNSQDLLMTPDGNVWIATSQGLNIYNYQADSIQVIKKGKNNLSSNDIMCFSPNSKGIWIATYDKGIDFYNYQTKKFEELKLPENIPCKYITSLLHDKYNNLWIGTLSNNLICYSIKTKTARVFNMPRVEDIFQDSYGSIWIAASKLYCYNSKTSNITAVNLAGINLSNHPRRLAQNKNGFLWIGFSECLGYFSLKDYYTNKNKIQLIEIKQTGDNWGIPFSQVTSIMVDNDNNVWIGTYGDGVYFMHGKQNKFVQISNNVRDASSISGNNIKSISAGKNGRLYVSIAGKGIDELNNKLKKTKTFSKQNFKSNGISSNFINCGFADSKGNIWVGSNGLDRISSNGATVAHFDNNNLIGNTHVVIENTDGIIWVGTENGLFRCRNNVLDDSFNRIIKQRIDVRAILIKNNVIWIGTYGNGLLSFDPISGKILNYENIELTQNFISSLRSKGDTLYIATLGGGIRLFSFSKKKYLKDYNQANGLRSDFVQAIEIDRKGRLWMASNMGISCIEDGKIRHFDAKDGIVRNEFSSSIKFYDENDVERIAFGGNKGIFYFNPNDLPVYKKEYKVFFSSLKIFNQKVYPNDNINGGNPLITNIINTKEIELNYRQSYFSLGVICTNFNYINNIIYSYKLKGIDNEWSQIGQDQEISFRNLKAGKYTLLAKASSSDNVWNSNVAELEIIINPPFWLSVWAYLLYILLLGIVVYFLWRASTINLRAQHQINLEKTERQKEEEIYQAKLRFFTNISHELRTPLTLIIGPVKNLINSHPDITNQLSLIDKNARKLLSLVNQLLDFRKTETGNMKLKVSYNNLSQQINNIISSFDSLKQEKKMKVSLQSSVINFFGWYDADFIDKIMFNLLSNAYKFTTNNGHISVEINKIEKNYVQWASISVSDNGIGIKSQDLNLIFDRFFQSQTNLPTQIGTGIGLHLVKNLVDIHRGNIDVSSFTGKGSVFTVEIPMDKSVYLDLLNTPEGRTDETAIIQEDIQFIGKKNTQKSDRITILVVDDEEDICTLIKQTLPHEYNILTASNGVDALSILKNEDCNLVISDIMMPEMDGIALCNNIKSNIETSHIPVILLTAKSAIEDKIEGLKSGADSYISKPFHPDHLLIRIEKLIESRKIFQAKFNKTLTFDLEHLENPSFDDIFLKKLLNYINQNLVESEMTGDQISSALNMSRMTLHRKVKQLTGQSIMELIKSVRLKEATYQLENTNKNISDICYEVGFNSPSYFTICFQSQYGLTPTDYQKKNRKV